MPKHGANEGGTRVGRVRARTPRTSSTERMTAMRRTEVWVDADQALDGILQARTVHPARNEPATKHIVSPGALGFGRQFRPAGQPL